jgi:oxygen-dependent protoporphyrinogen oxidase
VDDRVDTIVVGAGMAGLVYAHARGPDADLLVLEAGERAGGLVRTGRHELPGGALHFEWGPEALQDDAPETRALLAELGLVPLLAPDAARRRYVVRGGRLVPLPTGPVSFLTSPLLSWSARLRALTEPFRAKGRALDGSVADFARHRLGDEVLARLVDPFVTGVYAGDPGCAESVGSPSCAVSGEAAALGDSRFPFTPHAPRASASKKIEMAESNPCRRVRYKAVLRNSGAL